MRDDRREKILARIKTLLDEIAAANVTAGAPQFFAWRDRAELNEDDLPAYVLLDGVEARQTGSSDRRGPQIMTMLVQIFYVPLVPENQLNEGIGEAASDHRNRIIAKLKRDGGLEDLCGSAGYVEYRGMETDMQTGADVKGQFKIDVALAYTLDFNKL